MNDAIFEFFGFNQTWKTITDILLIGVLALVAVLAVCGLVQLIKRRSLKAVDAELTAMIPSLALVAVIYYVFEKVWILNYRPVGRVASGMHWATDALAGVIFGFDLALVYGGVLKMMKERRVE